MAPHPLRRSLTLLTLAIAGITAPFFQAGAPALANQPDQAPSPESTSPPVEQCVTYSPQTIGSLNPPAEDRYLYSPVYKPVAPRSMAVSAAASPDSQSDSLPPTEAKIKAAITLNPNDSRNYRQLIDFLDEHDRQAEVIGVYQEWIKRRC